MVPFSDTQNPAIVAIRQREPVVINDPLAQEWNLYVPEKVVDVIGQLRLADVPIPKIGSDAIAGVIGVTRPREDAAFSERDLWLFQSMAGQIAVAIQRAQLFQQTQTRARHEQTLRQITTRVRGFTEPEAIVRAAVRELGTALGRPAFCRLGSEEVLRMNNETMNNEQ